MEITIYSLLNLLTGFILLATGFSILFLSDRTLAARLCGVLSIITGIWTCLIALSISIYDLQIALILTKLCHFFGTLIASFFLLFSLAYRTNNQLIKEILGIIILFEIIFSYLIFFSDTIIKNIFYLPNLGYYAWSYGTLNFLFNIYFGVCWLIGILLISKKFGTSKDHDIRQNNHLILIAFLLGVIPPSILTILLPQIRIFDYYWLGPFSCVIWISIIAYSITKHKLFNIKLVATELVIFVLWIFISMRVLLASNTKGLAIECALLSITIILGIFLLKEIIREIKQREKIEELINELQKKHAETLNLNLLLSQKVAEQTHEIRQALEAEKHARQELERLNDAKNQFIMITQHNMRTPLRNITWNLESASQSSAPASQTSTVSKIIPSTVTLPATSLISIKSSTNRLTQIVDDFLNITTLKPGGSILDITSSSLKPSIETILTELEHEIKKLDLKITYPTETNSWPKLNIDEHKIKEILFIILENAVRYNHARGHITVSTSTDNLNNKFQLEISNSGLGITPEESTHIGSALFYRGENARKVHPVGMGIGLSLVKTIIKAHHGIFTIESDGPNKGAKATIILPLN